MSDETEGCATAEAGNNENGVEESSEATAEKHEARTDRVDPFETNSGEKRKSARCPAEGNRRRADHDEKKVVRFSTNEDHGNRRLHPEVPQTRPIRVVVPVYKPSVCTILGPRDQQSLRVLWLQWEIDSALCKKSRMGLMPEAGV
ncbi:autophagy-related 12 isoform X1 [Haemaphysalis longicornis]